MLALCFALPELLTDGSVPEWIEILPAGEVLRGIDGREFQNPDPEHLIAEFNARKNPLLPIDINHGSELPGRSLDARAIGWITELQNRNGSIWAKVEWNDEGRDIVSERRFRFISPAFDIDRETLSIKRFSSVGVVNHPNFTQLAALNSVQELQPMEKRILEALGLSDGASVDDVVKAINSREVPNFEQYVPRADYELALNARKEVERRLAEIEQKAFAEKRDAVLNKAVEDLKIAPASVDYYRATCRSADDLAALEKFLNTAAPVVSAVSDAPKGEPEPEKRSGVLTEAQRHICRALQIDPEQYAKDLAERKSN